MSLLDNLSDKACWEAFYVYKASLACPKYFLQELRSFIDSGAYLPVCENIRSGKPFPLPRKAVISKQSSRKKRTVYIYPRSENNVLKLLTWLLLRRYDCFCAGLYSFRPRKTAQDAIRRLHRYSGMYSYKADIHDYFNSIPVGQFLPMLESAVSDDPELFAFLKRLLTEERVLVPEESPADGDLKSVSCPDKGIMAGTPLSAFYANLYLSDLDRHFEQEGVPYARYSDDIIIFSDSPEKLKEHADYLHRFLAGKGLTVNPDKEMFGTPESGFTFLGFSCRGRTVDIAPATVDKLKAKMRRKARALRRWSTRNGKSGEKAAAAFIRIFNRKLFENPGDSELSWCRWFFSVINTTDSLHEIDLYAQDCLRFLISGKRTKSRYNVRYEDLKKLGYRSLVNAFYSFSKASSPLPSSSSRAPSAGLQ